MSSKNVTFWLVFVLVIVSFVGGLLSYEQNGPSDVEVTPIFGEGICIPDARISRIGPRTYIYSEKLDYKFVYQNDNIVSIKKGVDC